MSSTSISVPFCDLFAQYNSIKGEIDEAIRVVIAESGFIRGRQVQQFEDAFASALGVRHCLTCGNGTDALYIAMKGLGLVQGNEVITTAHSWISTSETISQAGGSVVFCDTKPHSYNIDPSLIEKKITRHTVGIIVVHLYGEPADMDPILEVANRHGLWVIEDCAQAHFATYKGRLVGTMGNIATFSFYPGKNLGAMGDAGCIVSNDTSLSEWCSLYARHGGKGLHEIEGINSRMDGIQASILLAKLPHLNRWNRARRRIAALYNEALNELHEVKLPYPDPLREHVYHLYVIGLDKRDELRRFLLKKDIATSINYPKALPLYPAYSHLRHKSSDFPVASYNQERILSLPMFPEMTDVQVEYVVRSIREFFH